MSTSASAIQSGLERARLLEHLVYQQLGGAVGEIASILLSRGALSFPQLIKLTSLPPALVHSSLLVLSTHTLLFHSETEVGGRLTELYELNHDAVERRIRGGLYVEMASEWDGGEELSTVIEVLWKEGILTREDLYEVMRQKIMHKREMELGAEQEEPKGKKRARTEDQATEAAERLVRKAFAQGFVNIVTPGSQLSPSSLEIKWEEELRSTIKGIPTTKELARVKKMLREKQEEWAEEEQARARGKGAEVEAEQDDDEPKRKKRRKKGKAAPVASSDEDELEDDGFVVKKPDPPLPEEVFFKINEERFHIRWRAQLLRSYAGELYNSHVATVFGVILDIVSTETQLMIEPISRFVSLHEINKVFDRLPESSKPDLSQTFAKHKQDSSWPPKRDRSGDYILAVCEVLSGLDQWGVSTREHFLMQQGEGSHAKWAVDWRTLGKAMKRSLVEAVVRDKLGEHAIRCWRILEAKGKLDEKHLARLAFLSVKETREVLGRLSSSGLIEPQEVPRSADRAPSRTLYLWFVDFNKVVTSLIAHHYKALANLQAQRQHQLEERRGLVDKRERTDVRENEALLTKRDQEAIAELDKTMEALAVAEQRLDEQLFVLREFDPDPAVIAGAAKLRYSQLSDDSINTRSLDLDLTPLATRELPALFDAQFAGAVNFLRYCPALFDDLLELVGFKGLTGKLVHLAVVSPANGEHGRPDLTLSLSLAWDGIIEVFIEVKGVKLVDEGTFVAFEEAAIDRRRLRIASDIAPDWAMAQPDTAPLIVHGAVSARTRRATSSKAVSAPPVLPTIAEGSNFIMRDAEDIESGLPASVDPAPVDEQVSAEGKPRPKRQPPSPRQWIEVGIHDLKEKPIPFGRLSPRGKHVVLLYQQLAVQVAVLRKRRPNAPFLAGMVATPAHTLFVMCIGKTFLVGRHGCNLAKAVRVLSALFFFTVQSTKVVSRPLILKRQLGAS
ncbi:RNA polymerase III subunit C82 [Rhodotorula toruloides]